MQQPATGYRPELDGVRALAVLAVMGFHLSFALPVLRHVFRGGFLGVDVFFVLSGMLITQVLVAGHLRGGVSLPAFAGRRARRLLPALGAMAVVVLVVREIAYGQGKAIARGLWATVTYVTVGRHDQPFGPALGHVWSLVVEWEFYLLWPLVLVLALRRGRSPEQLALPVLAAAVALFVVRGLVFAGDGGDWALSYHSAWLRFDELLLGAAVGLAGHRGALPGAVRTAGLVCLVVIVSRADYPDSWLYQGGMAVVAVAAAVLVQPRLTPWAGDRLLGSPPMVWVGRLSYSLYLWSVPVIAMVGHEGADWPRPVVAVVAIGLSFGLAAASYWLVEARFRAPSRAAALSPP